MITKKCALTLGGFALTTFLFFISLHVTSLFKTFKWMGVGVAGGVFVIMLIFTLVYRKNAVLPFFVIPINAIADGLAASSLFTHIGVYPQIWQTAILFAAVNAAFFCFCLFAKTTFFKEHFVISILCFCVTIVAALITATLVNDTVKLHPAIIWLAWLSLIPFISFIISTAIYAENALKQIKNVCYGSFAALILIIIVVITVISQGEALDGFGDGLGGDVAGSYRRRNPFEYRDGFEDVI